MDDAKKDLALPGYFFGPTKGRVLVAEDQDDLRRFIVDLLAHTFEVIEAFDGEDAW